MISKYIYNKITDILEENDILIEDFIEYAEQQNKITKYYLEFVNRDYYDVMLQTKWFYSRNEAEDWLFDNFDHIDFNNLEINLMSAEFDVNEEDYSDVDFVCEITSENYFKISQRRCKKC